MTALNKQALIAKIKKQTESFDTVVLKEDEANALLDELSTMSYRVKTLGGTVDIVDQQRDIWMGRCKDAEEKLEAAEKRIAELQIARDKCFLSGLKTGWEYGIADDTEGYNREIADAQAVIDRAAGIGVKGE
ncbi:hypothetical protein [Citrobacter portucalensis]|uniref:hypothetical protein n=1 Tax=Citrobacter portucalensis TaxID=1639133 RepID=UPI0039FBC20F